MGNDENLPRYTSDDIQKWVDEIAAPMAEMIKKEQYSIAKCDFSDIRDIFEKYHYKGGHIGGGIPDLDRAQLFVETLCRWYGEDEKDSPE